MRGGQVTDNVPLLTNDANATVIKRLRAAWVESGATIPELLEYLGTPITFGEAGYQNQYVKLHNRLTGNVPLIRVDPILFPLAEALGLDPAELIASAVRDCAGQTEHS
jgi:hypothetical protein